jgi:uracil-DNA glycosylase
MTKATGVLEELLVQVRACRLCESALPAGPRPIVQFSSTATVLIIGQAPGSRVHTSGVPWSDPSGDRLRQWTGLTPDEFYDPGLVALMPMGLCYPGKGSAGDLPPRAECAPQWHARLLAHLPPDHLTLLVGHHAQQAYIPGARKRTLSDIVRDQEGWGADQIPLPHPSWRSSVWMQKNPWFERAIVPALQAAIRDRIGR